MDSDIEDSGDEMYDCHSYECENEIEHINYLYQNFLHDYDACPEFFMGSLQEACEKAFNSSIIEERRPILVYIHHNKSPSSKSFCSNIFCSEKMIEYLSKNYIIWPWNITHDSNLNKLKNVWREIFPIPLNSINLIKRCPILIGIMHQSLNEEYRFVTPQYQFHVLFEGDALISDKDKLNYEILLKNLITFKMQFDRNEHALSFNFILNTRLCLDVILHVAEYLSLNDAVTAFSLDILPILLKYQQKFHLSEPSDAFIKLILQNVNPERIVSLSLKAFRYWLIADLSTFAVFTDITSLTLLNLQHTEQLNEYTQTFSKLHSLSLDFDDELNYDFLRNIICNLSIPIKRLQIRSTTVFCNEDCTIHSAVTYTGNSSIEYFKFKQGQSFLTEINEGYRPRKLHFPSSFIDLIRFMKRIQYVSLTMDKSNIIKLLNVDQWKALVRDSYHLKKVTLTMMKNQLPHNELTEKILNIQTKLCDIRATTRFQIKIF